MDDGYQIVREEKLDPAWGIIGQGIDQFNEQMAGLMRATRICFSIKSPDQEIVGGVIAVVYWDWLYIDLMWMQEGLRRHGYGHRLLTLAEDEGRLLGAKNAFLDTFSFQAPGFYEKHGYHVFGTLDDFPPGHKRFYYTKRL